jgi:hypothetical protein
MRESRKDDNREACITVPLLVLKYSSQCLSVFACADIGGHKNYSCSCVHDVAILSPRPNSRQRHHPKLFERRHNMMMVLLFHPKRVILKDLSLAAKESCQPWRCRFLFTPSPIPQKFPNCDSMMSEITIARREPNYRKMRKVCQDSVLLVDPHILDTTTPRQYIPLQLNAIFKLTRNPLPFTTCPRMSMKPSPKFLPLDARDILKADYAMTLIIAGFITRGYKTRTRRNPFLTYVLACERYNNIILVACN